MFQHFPLGSSIPNTPHAVCASLPTMRDVIAYEEKDPVCRLKMKQGYPRFVRHNFVEQVIAHIRLKLNKKDKWVLPVSSHRAALSLLRYSGVEGDIDEDNGIVVVSFSGNETSIQRANDFLQHTGFGLSSRQAEDYLCAIGILDNIWKEDAILSNPLSEIIGQIKQVCPNESQPMMARSGMSALYAAIMAAIDIQNPKGRNVWIQLGWLYLDTQRLLEKFLPSGSQYIKVINIFDIGVIEKIFLEHAGRIAGIITEVPTNPLIQTADIEKISELAENEKAIRIFDPSLSSLANLDLLPYCDVQISSLTKYAASKGDVMSGVAMCNPQSAFHDQLIQYLPTYLEEPYIRDIQRLASQISLWKENIEVVNKNTLKLAAWFEKSKSVDRVYWAYAEPSRSNYTKLAGGENSPGGMITIDLNKPLASFYDPAQIVKGPSFGTYFTMMCPFMYLAHYDQVNNEKGRKELLSEGLNPDSVRISCGAENIDDIIAAFDAVL
jgi:cystathionine gamma-synthase